jgi:hypothetical protein
MPTWKEDALRWAAAQQGKHVCACGCGAVLRVYPSHYYRGIPTVAKNHGRRLVKSAARQWVDSNQGLHFCSCGCGEVIPIKIHHHKRGIPRFLNHHSVRVDNPMAGRTGSTNPHYKGGRYVGRTGYVYIHTPAKRSPFQYTQEHRLVMERHLGRKLRRGEIVHHKNRIKSDNRIENLELLTNSQHSSLHARAGETGFAVWRDKGRGARGA